VTLRLVDCQCFAGGLTLGGVQAGLKLIAKRETSRFGVANCEVNRPLLGDDWQVQVGPQTSWEPVIADIMLGNPSCGGFSVKSASGLQDTRGEDAASNEGMWNFVNYAGRCRPTVAIFESVTGAYKLGHGLMRRLRDRLQEVSGLSYGLTHVRHSAHTLGGAGLRPRYFWVASRVPFGVGHRSTANVPVLRDVIGDLETQPLSMGPTPYAAPATWWSQLKRSPAGVVDGHDTIVTPKAGRLADLLAGPFTWREGEYLEQFLPRYAAAGVRIPHSMVGVSVGIGQMIRWEYDEPARTVVRDTSSMGIHPVLDRFLTHREVARVMGYPDDWQLEPIAQVVSKHDFQHSWGKGVTVECGRWIATWAKESIEGRPGPLRGTQVGDREWDVDVTHGLAFTEN
jgi:site-specific DNA-cytosine methylase